MGFSYMMLKRYKEATVVLRVALMLAEKHKIYKMMTNCRMNLATVYKNNKDTKSALECYQILIDTLPKNNKLRAESLCESARIYNNIGDEHLAIELLNLAMSIFKTNGLNTGVANCLKKLASIYIKFAEYTMAKSYVQQAISLMPSPTKQKYKMSSLYDKLALFEFISCNARRLIEHHEIYHKLGLNYLTYNALLARYNLHIGTDSNSDTDSDTDSDTNSDSEYYCKEEENDWRLVRSIPESHRKSMLTKSELELKYYNFENVFQILTMFNAKNPYEECQVLMIKIRVFIKLGNHYRANMLLGELAVKLGISLVDQNNKYKYPALVAEYYALLAKNAPTIEQSLEYIRVAKRIYYGIGHEFGLVLASESGAIWKYDLENEIRMVDVVREFPYPEMILEARCGNYKEFQSCKPLVNFLLTNRLELESKSGPESDQELQDILDIIKKVGPKNKSLKAIRSIILVELGLKPELTPIPGNICLRDIKTDVSIRFKTNSKKNSCRMIKVNSHLLTMVSEYFKLFFAGYNKLHLPNTIDIPDVTYEEMLLVWNYATGNIDKDFDSNLSEDFMDRFCLKPMQNS
jgi:tetratricopeptide (TPR) repeat protein